MALYFYPVVSYLPVVGYRPGFYFEENFINRPIVKKLHYSSKGLNSFEEARKISLELIQLSRNMRMKIPEQIVGLFNAWEKKDAKPERTRTS